MFTCNPSLPDHLSALVGHQYQQWVTTHQRFQWVTNHRPNRPLITLSTDLQTNPCHPGDLSLITPLSDHYHSCLNMFACLSTSTNLLCTQACLSWLFHLSSGQHALLNIVVSQCNQMYDFKDYFDHQFLIGMFTFPGHHHDLILLSLIINISQEGQQQTGGHCSSSPK